MDTDGKVILTLSGGEAILCAEDLLIETTQSGRYVSLSEGGITVALDTELSDALIEEGYVREIISKVQTMRKEAGFEVTDHITLYAANNEKIKAVIDKNSSEIKAAVLSDLVIFGAIEGYSKNWDINGEDVTLAVKKV